MTTWVGLMERQRRIWISEKGSAIAEDRTLREKFYELKLQANFLAVSPAYLTTRPMNIYNTQGSFTGNSALKTTQVLDVVGNQTGFYVVRYACQHLSRCKYLYWRLYSKANGCIGIHCADIQPDYTHKYRLGHCAYDWWLAHVDCTWLQNPPCWLHRWINRSDLFDGWSFYMVSSSE